MRLLTLTLVFILSIQCGYSQNLKIGIETGYGLYQLNNLKDFQSEISLLKSGLKTKVMEHFPNNIYYSSFIEFDASRISSFGIELAYHTTGGRNHIKDYSGEYALEMKLNGYSYGIYYKNRMKLNNNFEAIVGLGLGIVNSYLLLTESITISDINSDSQDFKVESMNFYGKPIIGISYKVHKKINIHVSSAYQFDATNNLHLKDNENAKLRSDSNKNIDSNWSGMRFSLGMTYLLF